MASGRIIWKIHERWRAPSLCDRAVLYPALHLRRLGFQTEIRREVSDDDLAGASALVVITDGALTACERQLVCLAAARGLPVVFCPQDGIAEADRDFVRSSGVVAWQTEPSILPRIPTYAAMEGVAAPICSAFAIEDTLLGRELPGEHGNSGPLPADEGRYIIVHALNSEALGAIRATLETWRSKLDLRILVTADEERLGEFSRLLPDVIRIGSADPSLLQLLARAELFVLATSGFGPHSPRPAQWVMTALAQGTPAAASPHPSLHHLADLCAFDDLSRGLAQYLQSPLARAETVLRAQKILSEGARPERIASSWSRILRDLKPAQKPPIQSPVEVAPAKRLLVSMLDLSQDIDLVLPILLAVRESGVLRQQVLVTDWLREESPRTLVALADAGFRFDIISRAEVRKGHVAILASSDATFCACDSTASPHKTGYAFARTAQGLGLPAFSVQHGFENVGLNYRDDELGPEVGFGSGTVFVWFPKQMLPPWVAPTTRQRLVHVGCPKFPPKHASALPSLDRRWRRIVGVFENLHWRRFDGTFRENLLNDLQQTAMRNPEVLFLVKPHHAGRWLSLNRSRLAESANILVIDPKDPKWQPFAAPALINAVDAVLTTPSTVALDAALAGKPVAVLGYSLDLPLYSPLAIIRSEVDWDDFLMHASELSSWSNAAFLGRALVPGRADLRIAAHIEMVLARRGDAA